MTAGEQPRPELLHAKLRGLLRSAGSAEARVVEGRLPAGAVAAADADGRTWVLADADPVRALGPVLLWLHRQAVRDANLVVAGAHDVGLVALRLAAFDRPPALWAVEGDQLVAVEVADVLDAARSAGEPRRFDRDDVLTGVETSARELAADLLDRAQRALPDLAVEAEAGAVVLTMAGLEVGRLSPRDGQLVFDVGVGAIDQDARRRVVGERLVSPVSVDADLADLGEAVAVVARHRRPGGPPHPLRRLQRSRWLRAEILADPAVAGLPADLLLETVADPVPRSSLHEDLPAGAVGGGEVVVCSAGIDLGVVPAAAHFWLQAVAPGRVPRLTLAVSERDLHPATEQLVSSLHPQTAARVVGVSAPWHR